MQGRSRSGGGTCWHAELACSPMALTRYVCSRSSGVTSSRPFQPSVTPALLNSACGAGGGRRRERACSWGAVGAARAAAAAWPGCAASQPARQLAASQHASTPRMQPPSPAHVHVRQLGLELICKGGNAVGLPHIQRQHAQPPVVQLPQLLQVGGSRGPARRRHHGVAARQQLAHELWQRAGWGGEGGAAVERARRGSSCQPAYTPAPHAPPGRCRGCRR